ncbi:MAG: hypothetical protein HY430_03655 [Candidatus Levybacteria bacterium]|nr:hypothetical protein [Candidatus Levybacteria bacterium]
MADDRGIKPAPPDVSEDEAQKDRELLAELLGYMTKWTKAANPYRSHESTEIDKESDMTFSIVVSGDDTHIVKYADKDAEGYDVDISLAKQNRGISMHKINLQQRGNSAFLVDPIMNEPIKNFTTEVMSYKSRFGLNSDQHRVVVTVNDIAGIQYIVDENGMRREPRRELEHVLSPMHMYTRSLKL